MNEHIFDQLEVLAIETVHDFFKLLKQMETIRETHLAKDEVDLENRGSLIRRKRKFKGWTQEKLAKESGLSLISIRRYESGERFVDEPKFLRILAALNDEEKE